MLARLKLARSAATRKYSDMSHYAIERTTSCVIRINGCRDYHHQFVLKKLVHCIFSSQRNISSNSYNISQFHPRTLQGSPNLLVGYMVINMQTNRREINGQVSALDAVYSIYLHLFYELSCDLILRSGKFTLGIYTKIINKLNLSTSICKQSILYASWTVPCLLYIIY